MSADNYYLIKKHPAGGYAALMGFMSDEREPEVRLGEMGHRPFPTLQDAMEFADNEYSEYGVRIDRSIIQESFK